MSKKDDFKNLLSQGKTRSNTGGRAKKAVMENLLGEEKEITKPEADQPAIKPLSITINVEWPKLYAPGKIPCWFPLIKFDVNKK